MSIIDVTKKFERCVNAPGWMMSQMIISDDNHPIQVLFFGAEINDENEAMDEKASLFADENSKLLKSRGKEIWIEYDGLDFQVLDKTPDWSKCVTGEPVD